MVALTLFNLNKGKFKATIGLYTAFQVIQGYIYMEALYPKKKFKAPSWHLLSQNLHLNKSAMFLGAIFKSEKQCLRLTT